MPDDETVAARTVVVGFGRVGRTVAELLREHGRPYIAVDADIDSVAAARRDGFAVRFADVARPGRSTSWASKRRCNRPDDGRSGAAIADESSCARNSPTCRSSAARSDADHAAALYQAGASDAVPETLSSLQLAEAVLIDLGVAMGPVIASIHDVRAKMRRDIMTRRTGPRTAHSQAARSGGAGEEAA